MPSLRTLLLCALAVPSFAAPPALVIAVPSPSPGPVAFGAAEIRRSAEGRGSVTRVAGLGAPAGVRLAVWPAAGLNQRFAPPAKPESYRLTRDGGGTLMVTGSDAVGVMYGALDLAEQLRWLPPGAGLRAVQPRERSPFLELRGVNQFLHQQALDDPGSWYFSDDFWQGYLDTLARTRHNFLDLHALYDYQSTGFPNVFPYLIHLDEYPEADIGADKTARNLAVFQKVIALAAERGIKVGLMNYNAPANVPGGKLADYTAKCVAKLLTECPGLWAFGFRIGESGQPEDFFKHSYLEGVRLSGRTINLYTRSWIASRAKIMEIADAHDGRFMVELKYNGEQLGLPYQVQGERMTGWGSYSYQTYTSLPHRYDNLWQVRACGTHRIFQWGDPDFVRRLARSCRLGDGSGFTTEPIGAYYPLGEYYLNPETFPQPYFRWEFQRNWLWYEVWGRCGYDPDVPDAVFEHLYRERYGNQAGPQLFRSAVAASRIIPTIFAYHCLGPDHRNMAPEMETGNNHGARRLDDGSTERVHQGLAGFLGTEPLDDSVMDSPRRYVDHLVKGEPTLPFGPLEASRALEGYARDALAYAALAKEVPEAARDACLDQVLDAQALAALARYYAAKIRGVTELERYRRAGDVSALDRARTAIAASVAHWGELAEVTGKHFTPLIERLRMYTMQFTWADEGKDLPRELDEIDALKQQAAAKPPEATPIAAPPAETAAPRVTVDAPVVSRDRTRARLTVHLAGGPKDALVTLLHRPLPSFYSWLATPMAAAGGAHSAAVPLTPEGLLYRVAVTDKAGHTWQWPDFREETPYREIAPWAPGWVTHGAVALPEGAPVDEPEVGTAVWPDRPEVITSLPPELTGLVGLRYPLALLQRAQGQSFGGYPITFRVLKPVRLFVGQRGSTLPGYGRYAAKGLALGDNVFDVVGRDYEPGDYTLVFARGPIPMILGFKALGADDKPLDIPSLKLGGQLIDGVTRLDFVTTGGPAEPYEAKLGVPVYNDRNYVIRKLPDELKGCIGLRFSNDVAKNGGLVLPFKLERPATLYAVFGNPGEGAWQKPPAGWRQFAEGGYQHGPGDEQPRNIYAKDYPAGENTLMLPDGTAVVLGFR